MSNEPEGPGTRAGQGAPDETPTLDAADQAGERAAKNTAVRALAEIIGKLASFVLFAVLARELGEADVGVYVFAFAFLQLMMGPVDFGLDRYLLREVARDHSAVHRLFVDILAMKLAIAVPVLGLSFVLVSVLDYSQEARQAVFLLAGGMFFDSVSRVFYGLFMAHERGQLVAIVVIVQRLGAAALGLAALFAGYGVVTVAATYSVASLFALLVAVVLLLRSIARPRLEVSPRGWHRLLRGSLPFGVQDVFAYMLFRADAVLLSLIATDVAVGLYGAAYRLYEATTFMSYAVSFAFQPMFGYLDRDTDPTLGAVFARSIKFAFFTLVPIAVVFAVLSDEICEALFGADFAEAGAALRLLAPVVVLDAVATLAGNLMASRGRAQVIIRVIIGVTILNVALNLALIPSYDQNGAAAAMLITEIVFVVVIMFFAAREVGAPRWTLMLAAPALAGSLMAGAMLALGPGSILSVTVGVVAYLAGFLIFERLVSPEDFFFVARMIKRRLPGGAGGVATP